MTALLLDTHALLWAIHQPDRLSPAARDAVSATENRLVVSAVSAWEIAVKHRLGRLPEAQSLLASFDHHVSRLGADQLPITSGHARVAGALEWDHRDPFDRMLAAQSLTESLTLVTADGAFARLGVLQPLW